MDRYRVSNAEFIAPLTAPVIMFVVLLIRGGTIYSIAFTAIFTGLISYFGFFLFVLPLHKSFKEKNNECFLVLVFSGLIAGAVILSVLYFFLAIILGSRESFELSAVAIGAMFGGSVSIVFGLLSGTTRLLPPKDQGIG